MIHPIPRDAVTPCRSGPPDPRCGTTAGYQAHKRNGTPRCRPCLDAAAADRRRRTAHAYLTGGQRLLIDATGTRRRVQALARIGWPLSDLGAHLGVSFQNVAALTARSSVRRSTATRVAALYDELSMLAGPSTSAAKRAQARGWPPPLAWDDETIDDPAARPNRGWSLHHTGRAFDEIAVQRAMRGDPVHLRPVERAEATRRLTAQGYSATQIAERLRTTTRSVTRQRRRSA